MTKTTLGGSQRAVDHADLDLTASQEFRKHGSEVFEATDARGRLIKLKRPNPLAKLRFIKALGPASANQLYIATVSPLMYVVSIGGYNVITPQAEPEIEALYQRLDEDGMEAITKAIFDHLQALDEVDVDLAKK